jgi:hypothetical protein
MKSLPAFLIFFLMAAVIGEEALACQCEFISERKFFRQARNIFMGKVLAVEKYPTELKPWDEDFGFNLIVTFQITKAWKGLKSGIIKTRFSPSNSAGCYGKTPEVSQEYLVYAYGKYLFIDTSVCAATKMMNADIPIVAERIRQLNSCWFRFKARAIPF